MNAARDKIAFEIDDSQRGKAAQERAFALGHSRAHFGQSAHNWSPAIALDVHPMPLDWTNIASFVAVSKVILSTAEELGVPLVWGGTWTSIKDYPHYELTPWREWAAKSKPFAG